MSRMRESTNRYCTRYSEEKFDRRANRITPVAKMGGPYINATGIPAREVVRPRTMMVASIEETNIAVITKKITSRVNIFRCFCVDSENLS